MSTLGWLRGMIFNPDLVWLNTDGSVAETESVPRFGEMSRWSLRPMWMHAILTTSPKCGCRKRFGLWRTIFCLDHAGIFLGEDE